MKSVDAIEELLRVNPNVSALRFFPFSTKTKLQERRPDLGAMESALVQRVLARKSQERIRFWDALLETLMNEGLSSTALLGEVFYHQANRDYLFVDRAQLRDFLSSRDDQCLALNSKVIMADGSSSHVPLLDFKIDSQLENCQLAEDCIVVLGLRGSLLDSGRSYHFIGSDLVTENEMLDLLAKFTLLHPISDKAWAAHQLIERSASLRVTAKGGQCPVIVRRIGR
jgi:hypothetical protein